MAHPHDGLDGVKFGMPGGDCWEGEHLKIHL